jgi:hypothetical protein
LSEQDAPAPDGQASISQRQHDLAVFFQDATEDMEREYHRIYKYAARDPGTAGDQGEENWRTLLERWLPPPYQVVTKGKILSAFGELSPQIDVLVLHPYYPKALLNNKYYLDAGVMAAFECKITLRPQDITQAVKNAATIRRSLHRRYGDPYHELHSPIIYGLLAHSHMWTKPRSTPLDNIKKQLMVKDKEHAQHPRESLDILCVADLGLWILEREAFIYMVNQSGVEPELQQHAIPAHVAGTADEDGPVVPTIATYYSGADKTGESNRARGFSPIGGFLSDLIMRLAWEDDKLRGLAFYFSNVSIIGESKGSGRFWAVQSVFSEHVYNELLARRLRNDFAPFRPWHYWNWRWD